MPAIEQPARTYYAIIPANVRYDETIPDGAKLLYGEITALSNEKGFCWATNDYFSRLYKVAPRTISRWVKALINASHVTAKTDENTGLRCLYLTTNLSVPIDKNVHPPLDENVQQNNTGINTTQEYNPVPVDMINLTTEWKNWKEFRRREFRKKFRTEESELLQFKKLMRLSNNNEAKAIEIINQSKENSWQGLFEIKTNGTKRLLKPSSTEQAQDYSSAL